MRIGDEQQDLGEELGPEHADRSALVAPQQIHRQRVLLLPRREQQQRLLRLQRRLEPSVAELAKQVERELEVVRFEAVLDAILVDARAGFDAGGLHELYDDAGVLVGSCVGLQTRERDATTCAAP